MQSVLEYGIIELLVESRRFLDMAASYKKLWKLLIDKDMKKEDLRKAAGITTTAMAKLGRNEDVKTSVLLKICTALQCDISDIMEIVSNGEV